MIRFISVSIIMMLVLTSCSSDDSEKINLQLIGEYVLTSFETTPKLDVNGDEVFSTNRMDETDCYNDNKIALTEKGDYYSQSTFMGFRADGGPSGNIIYTTSCLNSLSFPANYTTNGNQINVVVHESNGVQTEFTFEIIDNKITIFQRMNEILMINPDESYSYTDVDAKLVYTKI